MAAYDICGSTAAKVDIYLEEGMIDKAIATVDDLAYYQNNLVMRVMDAAIQSHPEWVINKASQMAEAIMNAGKAKYYEEAIAWLKKV
ncbi:MAG: hypothetical protein AAF298_14165 [Cyanobacteria bacterium P01_A01_bin.40]